MTRELGTVPLPLSFSLFLTFPSLVLFLSFSSPHPLTVSTSHLYGLLPSLSAPTRSNATPVLLVPNGRFTTREKGSFYFLLARFARDRVAIPCRFETRDNSRCEIEFLGPSKHEMSRPRTGAPRHRKSTRCKKRRHTEFADRPFARRNARVFRNIMSAGKKSVLSSDVKILVRDPRFRY